MDFFLDNFDFCSDLAVLRLAEPLPEFHNSIEPVVLSGDIPVPTAVCRLVGWGELLMKYMVGQLKY